MCEDKPRKRCTSKHKTHDEWQMHCSPYHARDHVTSNRMFVKVKTVNFEIDPVEAKGLDKPENGFTEESVQCEGSPILV